MQDPNVFRASALDRLSSPDQLDQVMRVTNPKGWIALSALGALLLAALVWALTGTLSERVVGQGILIKRGGVLEIVSSTAGRVTDVPVSVGDSIAEGQVVVWTTQPSTLAKLQQARMNLQSLREEHDEAVASSHREAALQREALAQQRTNLEHTIRHGLASLGRLRTRAAAEERLLEQGLLSRSALLETLDQQQQTEEKIRAAEAELAELEIRRLTIENRLRDEIRARQRGIAEAATSLVQLEAEFESTSQIVSPYTGHVLEVVAEEGALLSSGDPVLILDWSGRARDDLMAIVYVPAIHGKKVRPGMSIHIAPATVRQEEFGMMVGRVSFVSSYPASLRGMARVLKNEQLVGTLSGGGAPYEVHAELLVDPETPSRFRWSSSRGPPDPIQSGTLATGAVTISTQRPIEFVLPLLRRWTGT